MTQNLSQHIDSISVLIEKSISKVAYYEINYDEGFWKNSDHHSLDHGLEFTMSNNEKYYLAWDNLQIQYDLNFGTGTLQQLLGPESNVAIHDVTGNIYWQELVGRKIKKLTPILSWVSTNGIKKDYLQDLIIEFDNKQKVIISVSEIRDGSVFGMQDHISVFFNSNTAKKYGIGVENEL
ncbi:MAG: hypothetical protein ACI8ZM_004742 [Crocinitomix sp.]|jgi:hypothetical protein